MFPLAHCLRLPDPSLVTNAVEGFFGEISRGAIESAMSMKSFDFVIHEDYYRPTSLENDVALVRFPLMIPLSDAVKPINLPEYLEEDFLGYSVILSGWGHISGRPPVSTVVLRYVRTVVITNALCKSFFGSELIFNRLGRFLE